MADENTGWEDLFAHEANPSKVIREYERSIASQLPPISDPIKIKDRPIDKYSNCPSCKSNWDGGDIFEELCKTGALTLQDDVGKIAAMYGWTEHNKKRFTAVITHLLEKREYVECPYCRRVYDALKSTEYKSFFNLKAEIAEAKATPIPSEKTP